MKLSDVFYQLSTSPEQTAAVADALHVDVDQINRQELSVEQVNVVLVFLDFDIVRKEVC